MHGWTATFFATIRRSIFFLTTYKMYRNIMILWFFINIQKLLSLMTLTQIQTHYVSLYVSIRHSSCGVRKYHQLSYLTKCWLIVSAKSWTAGAFAHDPPPLNHYSTDQEIKLVILTFELVFGGSFWTKTPIVTQSPSISLFPLIFVGICDIFTIFLPSILFSITTDEISGLTIRKPENFSLR